MNLLRLARLLMEIDPVKQVSTVEAQRATENQKRALYEYNGTELDRQKKLHAAGIISQSALDQVQQAYDNSKADYESAKASRVAQERELSYYQITAPMSGVVGDIPVHVGDYVSPSTMLTTVDENRDLEAYIYVSHRAYCADQHWTWCGPSGHERQVNWNTRRSTSFRRRWTISFRAFWRKRRFTASLRSLRNAQLVKARVIWSTKPTPVVPVLAVTRLGGQTFVFVATEQDGKFFARQAAVTLGDTIGNTYAVRDGLKNGDKVIVSGTQFLVDGVPVQPLG